MHAVYGLPPAELVETPEDALQFSPLIPGSARLEDVAPGTLDGLTVLAPPGTIERRAVLALGLRALRPGGDLLALAPKERGGARLARELQAFGCAVTDEARRHHRLCRVLRPEAMPGLEEAIAEGAPRRPEELGLWTQPGLFSWNRPDPGSLLLLDHLPAKSPLLAGRGADLGCGLGLLALGVLRAPSVTALALVDIDRRAIEAAARNVADPRAGLHWADLLRSDLRRPDAALAPVLARLDFAVTNPPFHDGGAEDRALGQAFIAAAAAMLRPGGTLWLTANAHLPYEAPLRTAFRSVTPLATAGGYKVYEARR